MRSIIILMSLLLAMASGTVLGLPLQGSNDNATVAIFESSRMPVADENSTLEILKVDVGLMGAENASYELLDQNDLVYPAPISQIQKLSSGKQTVYFLTEMDSLFKLINVTPNGSDPIYINWWMTPNASNDRTKVRYYGIVDSSINSNEQMLVLQVSVQNLANRSINVTPFNFTLFDQWGWPYQPTMGFDAVTVAPGSGTERLLLGFSALSPVFRPTALAYDYGTPEEMVMEFEKDYVPLSNEMVYGTESASNAIVTAASAAPAQEAATTPVIQPVNQTAAAEQQAPASQNASIKLGSLDDKIAASKARLSAKMGELDKKNQEPSDAAISTAALNNSTATIL